MLPLPDLRSWRTDVDVDRTEPRVRWLRERILEADHAAEAQQRLIAVDGPLEAYLLSIESLQHSQRRMESELASLMRNRELEIMDFALSGERYRGHRAKAKVLSVFFDAMQRMFERVGQTLAVQNPGPKIPPEIRQLCQLEVAGFFPSSFGVRFATLTRADLTGTSLTETALETTFELVNSPHPVEQAARLGPRAMTSYRHLVRTLVEAEATPKVTWRTAAGEERHWETDHNTLLTLANRLSHIHDLKPRTLTTHGVLTGASLRRQKFEFTGDGGLVTGRAPHELAPKVTAFFGKMCQITYIETVFVDETTEQEKRSRVLVDITPA